MLPALVFNPSPADTDELLARCADPSLTLNDIAARSSTSLEALTLFLVRPDIAERLDTLHSAAVHRTRTLATHLLPKALNTLNTILDEFLAGCRGTGLQPVASPTSIEERAESPDASPHPTSDIPQSRCGDPHPTSLRHRITETARRAAACLLSLARLRTTRVPLAARLPVPSAEGPIESPLGPTVLLAPNAEPEAPAMAPAPSISLQRPSPPKSSGPSFSPSPNPNSSPLLPSLIPGRLTGLPDLPPSSPTNHRRANPPPRTAASLLKSAGASPHEHWP